MLKILASEFRKISTSLNRARSTALIGSVASALSRFLKNMYIIEQVSYVRQ